MRGAKLALRRSLHAGPPVVRIAGWVCLLGVMTGCGIQVGGDDGSAAGISAEMLDIEPETMVKVQFRRDALGAATSVPVSPRTGSFNGAETSLTGKFKRSTGDWIILSDHQRQEHEYWIPVHSILHLEVNP